LAALLAGRPDIRHIKVEDGPGRPLGRSFRVKLWPTLVFLRDGQVLRQAVRPSEREIEEGFALLDDGADASG
jgi:thioredoxin 1